MRRPRIVAGPPDGRRQAPPERLMAVLRAPTLLEGETITVSCPVCRSRTAINGGSCLQCGFPFVCDLEPVESPRIRLVSDVWRVLLGLAAVFFLLTSGVFVDLGTDEFYGRTLELADSLAPDTASGIPVSGPANFVWRTQLVLGLLKLRAPDFYWRIQDSVTGISYLAPATLSGPAGQRISLEGIGAMAEPASGQVSVLYATAFPSGPAEIYDRDLFSYAGVLVHELRHIELAAAGRNPGGWREEVLCEQAAYAAVKQLNAPPGVLLRYEAYLADPLNRRYQDWYDWYDQWE